MSEGQSLKIQMTTHRPQKGRQHGKNRDKGGQNQSSSLKTKSHPNQ